jgi:CheY-like chemotaxis protein
MNAILGFAQLSLSEPAEPLGTNQRKFIGQIVKAGKHLLALINEVLDLARIEAGKIELSVEAVSIANVANECLPLIENMARDLNVRVQPFEAITSRTVMADYIRLKQVLLNLLSNAVKYNRAGGEVSLTATHVKPDRIRLNVIDTGVGIPESVRGSLFQPFQRLVAESSVVEGTGIGLALAKKLVIAMGGEIGFDSVEGTGSTFWIELPIAPEAIEGVAAFGPREQIRNSKHIEKSSILYIEDNPANVMLMEHVAARMAITFATAHNAELGIALAGKMMPNLIIMDINLPQMDGYEALKCLKKNPDTASIPVIALSASAMENEVARGKAAGFVEYHTKPIDVDEIAAAISRLTGAHS